MSVPIITTNNNYYNKTTNNTNNNYYVIMRLYKEIILRQTYEYTIHSRYKKRFKIIETALSVLYNIFIFFLFHYSIILINKLLNKKMNLYKLIA